MTIARTIFCFGCMLLVCRVIAQPEQVQFIRGDITRGLSHNQVNCFYRDQQGFVWIGTMNGLNRYDGYAYYPYFAAQHDSTSLNDNYIDKIYPYPGGSMLVITRLGGNLYNSSTDRFEQNPERRQYRYGLPDTLPLKSIRDRHGNYWLLFSRGRLYKLAANTSKAEKVTIKESGASARYADVAEDREGKIWLITETGTLCCIDPVTLKPLYQNTGIARSFNGKISPGYTLFPGINGKCWIWLRNDPAGALLLQTTTNETTRYTAKAGDAGRLQNDNVTGITDDPMGYTWIATDPGGLHFVDPRTLQLQYEPNNSEDPYSISQNAIVSIYKDPENLIWLGTYKKGLNYFNPNLPRFPLVKHEPTRPNSLPYNDVNDMVEDEKGNLWIATNGGGLLYYDRQKNSYKRFLAGPGSISSNVIVCLCIDHAGRLWIGSFYGGLDCLENGKFTSYRPDPANPASMTDNNIWEIFEDSRQRLWIGTLRGGIHLFNPLSRDFTHFRGSQPNSVKSDYNSVTIEDHLGNIWFGTSLGIDILEASSGRFVHMASDKNKPGSLSNENIYTIFQDSKKRIWVGTREGLNLYRPDHNNFITYTRKDGLPDNTIINILEDDKGNLWLSTHNGLSQVQVVTDEHNNIQLVCHNYNELNNLQGRDFNENAALKTSRGELIFGGANGFNLFIPGEIPGPPPAAQIRFTGFDLFNSPVGVGEKYGGRIILPQSITTTDHIVLTYHQRVFSVEFATLDFAHTEKARFAYRLDGFNKEWLYTDAGIRKAHFTNLNPGQYLLHVRAYDNGVLSNQEAVLTIRILPPWWLSVWAFAAYALLLIGALVGARRFIIHRAKARFAVEQERKEARRMHELDKMKIDFVTNISHEFRTPLSLILAPLEKLQQTAIPEQQKNFGLVHRNVKRLLNLVNQLLDFRKLDVQELHFSPEPGEIVAFLKEVAASFTDVAERKNIHFHFTTEVTALQVFFDRDKMEKIIMNLLSNAYKFTRDGGTVSLHLKLEESDLGSLNTQQYLLIEVKDSGIGIAPGDLPRIFDRFYRNDIPGSIVNQGSGIGLAIVKEFVQLHDGTITVTSTPGHGSCFTLSFPVQPQPVEKAAITLPISPENDTPDKQVAEKNSNRPGNRPLVLVAEDNEEFRQFLTESLRQYYRVIAVPNGEEAWNYLQTQTPRLVISDVMMPVMDGVELVRKMKKNPATATIPILLLTARNAEEHQVEGLSAGANDYIIKPFSLEVLLQKIKNQLEEQKRKPTPHVTIATTAIPTPDPDGKWLGEVLIAVEANISNAEFSVRSLARLVNMSRAGLYKKLLALSGKTPVEFIREVRLERARQLLRQRRLTVSEIAYETGFTDPKYFAKTFKKMTGHLPSSYASLPATALTEKETTTDTTT